MITPESPFSGNKETLNRLEEETIDIKRYLSIFFSNWYWFVSGLFIAIIVAYGINRYSQKVWAVSSSILIKDDVNASMGSSAATVIPGGDIFRNQQNLRNEIAILKSYSLNNDVIKALEDFDIVYVGIGRRGIVESRHYKTCPFIVVHDTKKPQPVKKKVYITLNKESYSIEIEGFKPEGRKYSYGERFTNHEFDFYLKERDSTIQIYNSNGSNSYYFYFEDIRGVTNQYQSKLSVVPKDKDASVITLSVTGFVPAQEADYLDTLMAVYIRYGLKLKKENAEKTITFITNQLKVIQDSLGFYATKLELFRRENNFIDLKNETTIIQNRFQRFDYEKAETESQLNYYNYLLNCVNNKDTISSIISPSVIGITDQVLLRLLNEYSLLHKEKGKLGFNLVKGHPALELFDKQANETREALLENIKSSIASLILLKEETDKKIALNVQEISKLPSTEKKFVTIQRQFDLNNTIYTYLLEKRAESSIARASTLPDNRIIDKAQIKGLVNPKKKNNLMIALFLGLLIPGGAILFLNFFYNRVIDKKDVVRKTRVPIIGYVNHNDSRNEIAVVEKPGSSLSESFRSVRTALKYFVKENEVAIISISSTVSSEGKTFISINLAAIMAMLGKKVLLIGLDLRKPRINKVFEFQNSPGMSTFLSGNCTFEEIIKPTQINNLFYAPSGAIPPNPAELLETEQMNTFIQRAKQEFDYIIIDTPPIAIVTDALLLAKYADINLFIVRQRYTSCDTLELIEQLKNQGILKNMAIIINDISLTGYYGYGLRYGYLQGYGYTYGNSYYGSNYYGSYGKKDKNKGYYSEV